MCLKQQFASFLPSPRIAHCSQFFNVELKSRLLESLWHRDAVEGRSSGRGTEILRQFHRLGTGWAAITVYETWGDLFFEVYDTATTSTMTLQVDRLLDVVVRNFRMYGFRMDGHELL